MNIVYICNEYPPAPHGGIGSFTQLIAEKLVQEKHTVTVIGSGNSSNYEVAIRNGVSVRLMPLLKKNWGKLNGVKTLLHQWKFQRFLKKQLHEIQPDLIETTDWGAPLLKKPFDCPLIIRLHGSNTVSNIQSGKKISRFYFRYEQKAIQLADVAVSVSSYTGKLTQKTFGIPAQFTTIYNGVDTAIFHPKGAINRDPNVLLFVGRMHYYKGLDLLFAALNAVFEKNENIQLHLICTIIESYQKQLLTLVDTQYHHRIQFLGRIANADLANCYAQAHVTIVPSRTEAFPIVPLESMACGTPVLITDGFSAGEIVSNGQNGFLIHPNDPANLATEILHCFENPKEIEAMRNACIATIENNFTLQHVLAKNIEFYLNTIQHGNN